MEDSIINKIKQLLATHNPLTEECHVVYLLVEIRKFLDRLPEHENGILRFYCDWCLHTEKTRRIHAIASIAVGIQDSILNGHQFQDGQFVTANNNPIQFIYKEELLKNMRELFLMLGLPMDIFENENWVSFLKLLIQVLVDQPIILDTTKIQSICFRPAIGAAYLEVIFKDGQVNRFINVFG